jgi:DNA mismatch endonuclease (patch repair protein)
MSRQQEIRERRHHNRPERPTLLGGRTQRATFVTTPKRSWIMSRVRSRGNKSTELAIIKQLRLLRITGWRRHVSVKLPVRGGGKKAKSVRPDFVFIKSKVALFVDGDFWHGNPMFSRSPTSNREYWENKIRRNRQRDRATTRMLRKAGWRVVRVWESSLKAHPVRCCIRVRRALDRSTGFC